MRALRAELERLKLQMAVQSVAVVHETAVSTLFLVPVGVGVGTTDQVFPFQRSATGFWWLRLGPKWVTPTAKHNVALAHDTPVNSVDFVDATARAVTGPGALAAGDPDAIAGPARQVIAATIAAIGAARIDLVCRR